jgi:hypothetical protein
MLLCCKEKWHAVHASRYVVSWASGGNAGKDETPLRVHFHGLRDGARNLSLISKDRRSASLQEKVD